MKRRLSIVALASLTLGACADLSVFDERLATAWGEPAEEGDSDTGAEVTGIAQPNLADPQPYGYSPIEVPQTRTQTAEVPPPEPRRKPDRAEPVARADPDPDLLVGLDFEATKALLGDPALKIEQPPAQVWAYNGDSCMFSVFFYPSMDDSVFRVLTYEVSDQEPVLPVQTASGSGGTNVASATSDTGAAKIRDRASPTLRRCFAQLLHGRDVPDAG